MKRKERIEMTKEEALGMELGLVEGLMQQHKWELGILRKSRRNMRAALKRAEKRIEKNAQKK